MRWISLLYAASTFFTLAGCFSQTPGSGQRQAGTSSSRLPHDGPRQPAPASDETAKTSYETGPGGPFEGLNWQIPGDQTNENGLKVLLDNAPNLQGLRVGWPGMSDRAMANIVRFKKLSRLQISNTIRSSAKGTEQVIIKASGWKELAALKDLQVLRVDHVPLDEKSLREISKLTGLTDLHLSFCKVSDAGAKDLIDLKKLSGLSLVGSSISDSGLEKISKLRALETLEIGQTAVTDRGLLELTRLPRLRRLSLLGTNVSDEGLEHLAQMSSLRGLDLRQTKVTEKGKEWLRSKNRQLRIYVPPWN